MRTAIQLNPEAGHLYFLILGRAYFFGGDTEQALINLREGLSRNAANLETHIYLAATLALTGDKEAAKWEAEEIRVLAPDFSIVKMAPELPDDERRPEAAADEPARRRGFIVPCGCEQCRAGLALD